MSDFDPNELLSAYIDGELSADECRDVQRRLAEEADFRRLHDDFLRLRQRLKALPKASLGRDFAASVLRKIEKTAVTQPEMAPVGASQPSQVSRSVKPKSLRTSRNRWVVIGLLATSASIAIGLFVANRPGDDGLATINPPGRIGQSQVGNDPRTPELAIAPNIANTLQLAIDVTVNPSGQRKRILETLLGKYGIRIDEAVKMEDRIEKLVLNSRVIGDAQIRSVLPEDSKPLDDVELVYLEITLQQLNDFSFELKQASADIPIVRYDMLIGGEQDVLQNLHQSAERFAQGQPNRGFRLKLSNPLHSNFTRFGASTGGMMPKFESKWAPAPGAPQAVPGPAPASKAPMQKDGVQVPETTLVPSGDSNAKPKQAADIAEVVVSPPSRIMLIVRNLRQALPTKP